MVRPPGPNPRTVPGRLSSHCARGHTGRTSQTMAQPATQTAIVAVQTPLGVWGRTRIVRSVGLSRSDADAIVTCLAELAQAGAVGREIRRTRRRASHTSGSAQRAAPAANQVGVLRGGTSQTAYTFS